MTDIIQMHQNAKTKRTSGEQELQKVWQEWVSNPSPETNEKLLKAFAPTIRAGLRSWGMENSPNTITRAKILTLQTMKNYEPSKGGIRNYLLGQLQGLTRYSSRETAVVSFPERMAQQRQTLKRLQEELTDELGREPSALELADRSGLSLKRVNQILNLAMPVATSSFSGTDDTVGAEPINAATQEMDAWDEFVYYSLDPVDQVIMDYTLGLHGKKPISNEQLARKLRLSPGAVSQRKRRIEQMRTERPTSFVG